MARIRKSKKVENMKQLEKLYPILYRFPTIHNNLTNDFDKLIDTTEKNVDNENYSTLIRACLLYLFSVIEADIYYFNLLDKYDKYDDRHKFINKFKKTFKQVCKTWGWEELQQEYYDTKIEALSQIRTLRDKLTHPKEIEDFIEPSKDDFEKIKSVYLDYNNFLLTLMSDFTFSTTIPQSDLSL